MKSYLFLLLTLLSFGSSQIYGNVRVGSYSLIAEHEPFPILDLQNFCGDRQAQFVEELGEALHTFGFVIIQNHGIDSQLIEEAYDSVKEFFSRPLEEKKLYEGVSTNRGYKASYEERQDKTSDLQEYWHVGREGNIPLDLPQLQENVWPEDENFKTHLLSLYDAIHEQSQPLLAAISLFMGKESSFLSQFCHYGDSIMRVIHYLPTENAGEGREWKAPHRDPNLLTVIAGVSMKGLELQMPDGRWVQVPYIPNTLIVSASNMLESLSNGLIRSAPHRVVLNHSNVSRYSIPFFFHGQRDLSIAPQPECLAKTGGIALYPNLTVEEALKDHAWFKPIHE